MADNWEHPYVKARRKTDAKIRELERVDYNEQDVKEARQDKVQAEQKVKKLKNTVDNLSRENNLLKLRRSADQERVEQIQKIVSPVSNLPRTKPYLPLREQNSRLDYIKSRRKAHRQHRSLEQDRNR